MILCPITKVAKSIPSHVAVARADSGLDYDSWVICEQVRCVSRDRLLRSIGQAPDAVIESVSMLLRVLMDL